MDILKRFGSFFLATALICSLFSPAIDSIPAMAVTANASEAAEDVTAPVSITVTLETENCTLQDEQGQEISSTYTAEKGSALAFTVTPDRGYMLQEVTVDGQPLTADANGLYQLILEEDVTIKVLCSVITLSSFTVAAVPEGAAREKTFLITTDPSNVQIAVTAYSLNEYTSTDNLTAALADGSATELTAETIVTTNGTYFVYLVDLAGNMAVQHIDVAGIDTTAPEITGVIRNTEGWATESDYDIVFPENEDIAKVTVQLSEGDPQEVTPDMEGIYSFSVTENGSYTVTAYDSVSNTTVVTIAESQIDNTGPVVSAVRNPDSWSTSAIYTFAATDEGSGVAAYQVTIGGGTTYIVADEEDTYRIRVNANQAVQIKAIDNVGNETIYQITENLIDTTDPDKPVLNTSASEEWVNTDVTLTAVSQDAQSGIAAYWYTTVPGSFDEATWTKMDLQNGTGSVVLTEEQDTTYYVIAQDQAGRISEISTIRVAIDKTAPETISLTYLQTEESGYLRTVDGLLIYGNCMAFRAEATDAASGVASYEYKVVGQNHETDWVYVAADENGFNQIVTSIDDKAVVYIRAIDVAGNCTADYTTLEGEEPVQFVIENTPQVEAQRAFAPQISMSVDSGAYAGDWTNETVTIRLSDCDAISGVEYYEWRMVPADPALQATDWEKIPAMDNAAELILDTDINAVYYFRAISYAGNTSKVSSCEVRIQKTQPETATIVPEVPTGSNGWYTKLPAYEIQLPEQGAYAAPVSYVIRYSHNGVEMAEIAYDGANAPTITGDGVWAIQIVSVDDAGNEAAQESTVLNVDTQAPTQLQALMDENIITNALSSGAIGYDKTVIADHNVFSDFTLFKNLAVNITASADGGDSGMAAIYYQVVAENAQYNKSGSWTLMPTSGLQLTPDQKCHLFFKAVDGAGNIAYYSSESVLLDAQAPQGAEGVADFIVHPTNSNLSDHGIYYGDVTVNVHVEEPANGTAFSGLAAITYRVLCDGQVTQSGTVYPGTGATQTSDGRISTWDGQITISSALNNSNHVVLEVTAIDQAGNARTTTSADGAIQIDITAPQIFAEYAENTPATEHNEKAYFTGSRTLALTVTEQNFVSAESHIFVTDKDTGKTMEYEWTTEGNTHTAVLKITEDGHYTVTASITDAAGNNTQTIVFDTGSVAATAFVIDNTKPKVTLSYDNNESQGIYFAASRAATVTVEERNFTPDNFVAEIILTTENGVVRTLPVTGWISEGNTHTATVFLTADGIYNVAVTCTDIPGNEAEKTVYLGAAAQHWVLDQTIAAPQISGIQDNTPYAGAVIPEIAFLDINLDTISVTLYRTRRNEINVDVTEEMLSTTMNVTDIEGGRQAILDAFPEIQENDGIYTLVAALTDKAGNTASTTMTFSVNRFGSVYAYDEALVNTMGGFFQVLENDLIITEINPTQLVAGSAEINITRDGTPISDVIFTVAPVADGTETPGASGWYEYQYVIAKENFSEDGVYTVVLSTKDSAGNFPENTGEDMAITFAIDTTKPELSSVIGLEKAIVKADSLDVSFTANDNISIRSITVYIDGELLTSWDNLAGYTHSETFSIPAGLNRHVRIVIEDMAGNILDTDSADFAPGYAWQDVTVSTNPFLRFYANKSLFFGSIALVVAGGVAGADAWIFFLLGKRKKKA